MTVFKVGDRVLVEAVVVNGLPIEAGDVDLQFQTAGGPEAIWVSRPAIHAIPTDAATIVKAADIVSRHLPLSDPTEHKLRVLAVHLEAASAPKPTLREAAADLAECVERCVKINLIPSDGNAARTAAKLRAALSREPELSA